jgi:hypothetical protein
MLIVSTLCKSSSFGIASVRTAHSIRTIHPVHHHRQSRYAPRGPHLQASRRNTRQNEVASCPRSYGSSSSSSSAARTCSNLTAWPKSTASRGRCRGGASCVSSSSSACQWSVTPTAVPRTGKLTYHIRIVIASFRIRSCVLRLQRNGEVVLREQVLGYVRMWVVVLRTRSTMVTVQLNRGTEGRIGHHCRTSCALSGYHN